MSDTEPDDYDTSSAWKTAYLAEFEAYAVSRGWKREDAIAWADEIVDDALIDATGAPEQAARADVEDCEREAANAA